MKYYALSLAAFFLFGTIQHTSKASEQVSLTTNTDTISLNSGTYLSTYRKEFLKSFRLEKQSIGFLMSGKLKYRSSNAVFLFEFNDIYLKQSSDGSWKTFNPGLMTVTYGSQNLECDWEISAEIMKRSGSHYEMKILAPDQIFTRHAGGCHSHPSKHMWHNIKGTFIRVK